MASTRWNTYTKQLSRLDALTRFVTPTKAPSLPPGPPSLDLKDPKSPEITNRAGSNYSQSYFRSSKNTSNQYGKGCP